MFRQEYTPAINTAATRALCLQYIDDAGNSPMRSPTAKAAFVIEQQAGRISQDALPENIWVVVWFEFTKGSYTYPNGYTVLYKDAWHIAFARRTGNVVEVHDSEAHSGARAPYRSLAEVEGWFAAYGTRYAGWSTHCDGRQYVTKGNDDMEPTSYEIARIYAQKILFRDMSRDEWEKFHQGKSRNQLFDEFTASAEWEGKWQIINIKFPEALSQLDAANKKIEAGSQGAIDKDAVIKYLQAKLG